MMLWYAGVVGKMKHTFNQAKIIDIHKLWTNVSWLFSALSEETQNTE